MNIFIPHFFYNAGRITTYGILGGLMGSVGSFTAVSSRMVGFQKTAMVAAGVLIIVMGLAMNEWIPIARFIRNDGRIKGFLAKGFHSLSTTKSAAAYFPVGLMLGLLPCGPVYTALLAAAGTGVGSQTVLSGFLSGAGLMLVFGLGTVPALILVAKLASFRWLTSRRRIYQFGSVLMILVGAFYIVKGFRY